MKAKRLFFKRLINGSSRCCRCGHVFGKNEKKFFPYPPDLRLGSICEDCKKKERQEENYRESARKPNALALGVRQDDARQYAAQLAEKVDCTHYAL